MVTEGPTAIKFGPVVTYPKGLASAKMEMAGTTANSTNLKGSK